MTNLECLPDTDGLSCNSRLGEGSSQVRLEVRIHNHLARYYEGWLECDDSVCCYRTRMMHVYGRKSLQPDQCRGTVSNEKIVLCFIPSVFLIILWNTMICECTINLCTSHPCSPPRNTVRCEGKIGWTNTSFGGHRRVDPKSFIIIHERVESGWVLSLCTYLVLINKTALH